MNPWLQGKPVAMVTRTLYQANTGTLLWDPEDLGGEHQPPEGDSNLVGQLPEEKANASLTLPGRPPTPASLPAPGEIWRKSRDIGFITQLRTHILILREAQRMTLLSS